MDVLSVVEQRLGAVTTWPTYMLKNVFVEDPTRQSVREVAGFMYGNGVPHRIATRCFQLCNGGRLAEIECGMFEWFYVWNRSPHKVHMEEYWSVELKAWAWLNGSALDRGPERVVGSVEITEFGLEASGCAGLIQRAIDNVRQGRDNVKVSQFGLPLSTIDMNCR